MGTITVVNNVTLDGVMQAPGRPDEDTRDGFTRGGWAVPYQDEVMGATMAERMASGSGGGGLLLGRRTYDDFASYWPKQADNPYTEVLNNTPKYVASRTLREPLPWQNSTLLAGDAAEEVARLKAERDLTVLGSGDLLRTLIRRGLVDEYLLLIFPLVLGGGRRLFADLAAEQRLRLTDSVATGTGVIIATYRADA